MYEAYIPYCSLPRTNTYSGTKKIAKALGKTVANP